LDSETKSAVNVVTGLVYTGCDGNKCLRMATGGMSVITYYCWRLLQTHEGGGDEKN